MEVIAMQRCRPFGGGRSESKVQQSAKKKEGAGKIWEASCAKVDTNSFVEFDDELERTSRVNLNL